MWASVWMWCLLHDWLVLFPARRLKKLISAEKVTVNSKKTKANHLLKLHDEVVVIVGPKAELELEESNIPLEIMYEDEDLLVVNKEAGLVVHPGAGKHTHTLVQALLYHTSHTLSSGSAKFRPGIVHRLDKDTSGLLVVAKNDWTHERLALQFKEHSIGRTYWVLVRGVVQHDELKCEESLGRSPLNRKKIIVEPVMGKSSVTHFFVKERFRNATLLEVQLETGRTHQIRVHLKHLGYPVLGDTIYGIFSPHISRQALHAKTLVFEHPRSGKRITCDSSLPEDFETFLSYLRENNKD